MKIVVIGGTGLIGTKLVKNLRHRGREVVAASPSTGVNAVTGEGLAEAMGNPFGSRRPGCSPFCRMRSRRSWPTSLRRNR